MGGDKFSILWTSGLLLGMSILALWKGGVIAWRREIDNPVFSIRGGRAIAIGLTVAGVGVLGVVLALIEGMKLRQ